MTFIWNSFQSIRLNSDFIKKESLVQMFSCEFCEISKNTFFGLFFLTAAIFRLFLLKKMKFWDNSLKFYYFDEKTSPRSHLSHLSKLANLFLKDMSKFRANNHSWFVLILLSGSKKKMISDMKTTDFLGWKMPKE